MSTPTTGSSDQSLYLHNIVGLSITDVNFRNAIAGKPIEEIQKAIESRSKELQVDVNQLTEESLTALSTLTPEEYNMLNQIFQKIKDAGVKPREML